jgi:hypothetical protein
MPIKPYIVFFLLFISWNHFAYSKSYEVGISEKVSFQTGDIIKLMGTDYSVEIGFFPGSKCAVPGFNCGSGYIPAHPTYDVKCGALTPCPYILMNYPVDGKSGSLTIETEESCTKNKLSNCFSTYAGQFTNDEGCMKLKSPFGRYHCLERFPDSRRLENKALCEQLPAEIYALRWNCFYEYAVRYRDASFCDKYTVSEFSGRDRCLLKMAEILKDYSLCKKISATKEHSYVEQCQQLETKAK